LYRFFRLPFDFLRCPWSDAAEAPIPPPSLFALIFGIRTTLAHHLIQSRRFAHNVPTSTLFVSAQWQTASLYLRDNINNFLGKDSGRCGIFLVENSVHIFNNNVSIKRISWMILPRSASSAHHVLPNSKWGSCGYQQFAQGHSDCSCHNGLTTSRGQVTNSPTIGYSRCCLDRHFTGPRHYVGPDNLCFFSHDG
jgi:hypothetical protein